MYRLFFGDSAKIQNMHNAYKYTAKELKES